MHHQLEFSSILKRVAVIALITISAFVAEGCSDSAIDGNGNGTLTIGISSGGQASASPALASAVTSVTITSAKVVIGRIRFKNVEDTDSLDFRSDVPIIIDLNLDNTVQDLGSMSIPAGTYDETRFRIKKVDSADGSIYTDNPDMRDMSIRVAGYIDGNVDSSFVWTADFNEEQVHEFTPITISPGETVNLVFEFETASWFSDGAGGTLDPREALTTGSVQSDIEANIKAAFKISRR